MRGVVNRNYVLRVAETSEIKQRGGWISGHRFYVGTIRMAHGTKDGVRVQLHLRDANDELAYWEIPLSDCTLLMEVDRDVP